MGCVMMARMRPVRMRGSSSERLVKLTLWTVKVHFESGGQPPEMMGMEPLDDLILF
jgi:hypothetical protein